jgi:hypothetical protein
MIAQQRIPDVAAQTIRSWMESVVQPADDDWEEWVVLRRL